jgi:sterol desaturase/sphingolipid hydroxylase (fatty acid hydroxylase superfamily)
MSPILYAIPFFLALIAIEFFVSIRMGKAVYRFHDAITSLNIGFISETIRSIAKLMSIVVYALVVEQVASFTWDVKSPAVWLVSFFMYDFFYYWAHRSGHEVNLLWASHVVHHSSEEFNLSTALRQSWTNQFFYWIFYLPMAIVGIPVEVFAITALLSAIYQFWSHTRLVPKLGWIDRVFVTPSNHRVHHGRNPYCIDMNYGGTLIVWDRLFGTYAAERDEEPVVYGILTPLNSWSPVWGNIKNFVGVWREAFEAAGWRNKLMVVFAPPGWSTQGQTTDFTKLPDSTRFETPSSRWQKIYGLTACVLILCLVLDLLLVAASLSMPVRLICTVFIAGNTACLAMLFEGRRWAIALEALRATLVFGALMGGIWFHAVSPLGRLAGAMALVVSLATLAILYRERAAAVHPRAMELT